MQVNSNGLNFSFDFPYPSQRMPVMARNVVAASQPLAAQAGLDMLRKGGNAVDAALAAAMTLTVVEPSGNGIGSDAFALVWDGTALHGLNGSGRSPAAWTPEYFARYYRMPERGWDTVTVPGAVDAWARLWERYGKLDFSELFGPAIGYARNGFIVSPRIARLWSLAAEIFKGYPDFGKTFLPSGRSPRAGEVFACPQQAETLEKIAASQGESFYRGELAQQMAAHAGANGGMLTQADLADHRSEWVAPIRVDFGGVQVYELPPNGQGLAALIALGLLRHLEVERYPADSADSIHLQIESMKIGFAETFRHVADPDHLDVDPQDLLDEAVLAKKAAAVRMDRSLAWQADLPLNGGTVYLTVADADGMMVSYIQSNYMGFGSGIVVPGTGISFQNRGNGFSLAAGHPNRVAGGKRPFHTIIPGFVRQQDQPLMSFGVMGGHMQPQGHVQVMVRILAYGQNPQSACDAPRWFVARDGQVALEPGLAPGVAEELVRRGHTLINDPDPGIFGGAQLIAKLPDGYCAASDPRKDGQAVGF